MGYPDPNEMGEFMIEMTMTVWFNQVKRAVALTAPTPPIDNLNTSRDSLRLRKQFEKL